MLPLPQLFSQNPAKDQALAAMPPVVALNCFMPPHFDVNLYRRGCGYETERLVDYPSLEFINPDYIS
jgi:hypothetical protein